MATTGDEHQAEIDVASTISILDALAESGSPYVHTSGGWVLGSTGVEPANEDAPIAVAEAIAWRPALERTVRSAADRDVRSVVIRPAILFGHGRGLPAMYVEWARQRGIGRCVGSGVNRWTFVHADDLAELYRLALEQAPAGTLLNGSSGETLVQSELARAADRAAGGEGNFEPWPLDEARKELGVLADALALDQDVSARDPWLVTDSLRCGGGGRARLVPPCSSQQLTPQRVGAADRHLPSPPRRSPWFRPGQAEQGDHPFCLQDQELPEVVDAGQRDSQGLLFALALGDVRHYLRHRSLMQPGATSISDCTPAGHAIWHPDARSRTSSSKAVLPTPAWILLAPPRPVDRATSRHG